MGAVHGKVKEIKLNDHLTMPALGPAHLSSVGTSLMLLGGETVPSSPLVRAPRGGEKVPYYISTVPGSICNTVLGGEIAFFSAGVAF